MRENKFRAWDKDSKLMLYKEFYDHNWYTTPKNDEDGCHTYSSMQYSDQYHKELMQYTGLLDKNGKEIYEGDILKSDYAQALAIVEYIQEYARFGAKLKHGCYIDTASWPEREVIGNIYENPKTLAP
jgi:uncharacterized phage protein (TIGR01671 family)